MPDQVLYTRASRAEIRQAIYALRDACTGRGPDTHGIGYGFLARLGYGFFMLVKLAFITKARGGTDSAGLSWPDLKPETKAYSRRFGPGEQANLKRAAGLGPAHRLSPGGGKGLMTAAQEARWWQIYKQSLAWLAADHPIGEAKGIAAAIAWKRSKEEGAKTMLEVYGNRQVEILRDTGVLFNSLSPGVLTETGATAQYQAPPDQVMTAVPGELIVGTNVVYAKHHQNGKRKLWPDDLPAAWLEEILDLAVSGFRFAFSLLLPGGTR